MYENFIQILKKFPKRLKIVRNDTYFQAPVDSPHGIEILENIQNERYERTSQWNQLYNRRFSS